MPIDPIKAALDVLGRDSRLGQRASDVTSYLMDLLYYGEFSIFEQVASGESFDHVNLLGVKGHSDAPPLYLIGSFHTGGEPSPGHWQATGGEWRQPRRNDRTGLVYGLGSNSGKVDLALKILAASRFRAEQFTRPVRIIALSGEEAQSTGLHEIIGAGATGGAALVHAPTNLEAWTDHPGCVILHLELTRKLRHRRMPPCQGFFELHVDGLSSHAQCGRPGPDGLTRGLAMIDRLRDHGDLRLLEFDARSAGNRHANSAMIRVATSYDTLPDLGEGVRARPIADGTALAFPIDRTFAAWMRGRDAGVGAVESRLGLARNLNGSRPRYGTFTSGIHTGRDTVVGTVMLWTGPGTDTHELVEAFAAGVQQELRGTDGKDDVEIAIQVVQDRPAFAGHEGSEGLLNVTRNAMKGAGLVPVIHGGPMTTDAGLVRARGIETVVFGAGRANGLYSDDEHISIDALRAAFSFYERVIEQLCVQPADAASSDKPTSVDHGSARGV